jgi:hypothetical protein
MANEDRRVSGSIQVESDSGSPEKVAYDLCRMIANNEKLYQSAGNRQAILDLYAECLVATRGNRRIS